MVQFWIEIHFCTVLQLHSNTHRSVYYFNDFLHDFFSAMTQKKHIAQVVTRLNQSLHTVIPSQGET